MSVTVEIVEPRLLTPVERREMKSLYDQYYTGAAPTAFFRDLADKDWAILLLDGGRVAGFSTQKLYHLATGERLLFSGDTVVAQEMRNQPGLAGAFGHLMRELQSRYEHRMLYWLLISKGARTYRFLPTFFHRYHPGIREEPQLREKLNQWAAALFLHAYDPATGVLHFQQAKDRLRADELRMDAHSRFFRTRNPGWRQGDELCCLLSLAPENLNERGARVTAHVAVTWRLS